MIRIISWLLSAALFAVVTHIAYVMFVPQFEMRQIISDSAAAAGINRFAVLDAGQQQLILKERADAAVAGLCAYDLSDGMLVFDADFPEAMWSFAIYSDSGKDTYAINEAQAGTSRFRLTVKRSPGLLGMLWGEAGEARAIDDGWTVTTPSDRGLAIVWVALDDRNLRNSYAEMMKKSACHIEPES